MPDETEGPDIFEKVMSGLYTVSTLLLCAYIADVLLDGAVVRSLQPIGRRVGVSWSKIGRRLQRDRAWREGAPWVIWEATEATMTAAEEGTG